LAGNIGAVLPSFIFGRKTPHAPFSSRAGRTRCALNAAWPIGFLSLIVTTPLVAQPQPTGDPRQGRHFIETPVYSAEDDEAVLARFRGLRVADVSDGMDRAGLKNVGLVSPEIGPLWRDTEKYRHRIVGIAVTARYVPTNQPHAHEQTDEAFSRWVGQWYGQRSPEPFTELLRPGSVLVIDDAARADVGSIGSNNILGWKKRGCVGVVTNATARDTDEITAQRVPLYFRHPGRGIRPGRNEIESVNRPIVVGGVLVVPGDVIVADGDGVIVVPRKHAETVARFARAELEKDKAGRRRLYEELGLPQDDSVR
jgi:regulator of RNase E activity RraA